MAVVTELITELGFDVSKEGLAKIDAVEKRIDKLTDSLEKIGHTLTGGLGIKDYFIGALGRSQDIINTSRAIGMSTDALQEWQYAAKASGVSSEAVISDLENLRANFFMSEKGVLKLADSFKKMSAGTAYWYGNMYGLSKDTVLMLRQGSEAIKERQKVARETGAITPEEELEKAAKLNAEIEESKIRLQKMVDTIVLKVVPGVTKLFKSFEAWLAKDPGRVQLVIQGITAALIGLTAANIINGIKTLISVITPIAGMPKIILALAGAVYLLYKDFEKFQNGNKTFLDWNAIVKGANSAKEIFENLIKCCKDLYKWFKRLYNEDSKLGAAIKGIGEMIAGSFDAAWRSIESVGYAIGALIDWAANDRTWQGLKDRFEAMGSIWEGFGEEKYANENKKPEIRDVEGKYTTFGKRIDKSILIQQPAQSLMNETSIRKDIATAKAIKEALQIRPGATTTNNTSTTQDFNGATINIITGASPQDFVDFLQQQGANATSFNGLGFIN